MEGLCGMNKDKEVTTELLISEILRWGVRASLAVIVAGIVLSFVVKGGYGANDTGAELQTLLHGNTSFPRSLVWLWNGLLHLNGTAVTVAGLGLLILTPVLRVVASVVSYACQKDRDYILISSAVLAVVVLSFFLGSIG
jgi:uncharacterized membrane protein